MAMIKTYNGGIQLLGSTDIATYPIQPSDSRQDYHHAYSGKYSNYTSDDLEAAYIKLKELQDRLIVEQEDLSKKEASLTSCMEIDLKFGQTRDGQCRKQIGFTQDSLQRFATEQRNLVYNLEKEIEAVKSQIKSIEEMLAANTNLAIDTALATTEVAKATQEVSEARQKKATNYALYVGIALAIIIAIIYIARR